MKTVIYIIVPTIAFFIILINAFYGHLLFLPDSAQVVNRYSVYIHLQPEWQSGSKNILFDVTNVWYKSRENKIDNTTIISTYNSNQVQYINGKSYVELKHDFSNCQGEWQPMIYRKAVDSIRHEIEVIQGNQLSTDPDVVIYPNIENANYHKSQQEIKIRDGYAQFIPICTSKKTTSYNYSIKTDNPKIGFDVYFVPSSVKPSNFFSYDFDDLKRQGCFVQNKQSYSGTCNNLKQDDKLVIIFPDELDPWLTKVIVNLYEQK